MITRLFHDWERRLASVSKDRVVRPFDWGVDWLPAAHQVAGSAGVKAWVDEVMRDSAAFYALPQAPVFTFSSSASNGSGDDGGWLTFQSALHTPHADNNTVHARWFPAEEEAPIGTPGATRGRAVVVLPQWNSDAGGHVGLCRLLARFGVSALRLSLPYHDVRMPPELTRADYIVSSNIVRTVQVCRQAVLDARGAVAWLSSQGFERIGILGTSLGSCLSLLTTAHEPKIRAQALNHVSPWFADVVWRGLSTRHVRAGLDGHIDLDLLRDLWRPISPFSYMNRVNGKKTLLVYARYDLTFPVDLSLRLVEEFQQRGLAPEVVGLPCGHYSTGMPPFKYLDAYLLIRFLRKSL